MTNRIVQVRRKTDGQAEALGQLFAASRAAKKGPGRGQQSIPPPIITGPQERTQSGLGNSESLHGQTSATMNMKFENAGSGMPSVVPSPLKKAHLPIGPDVYHWCPKGSPSLLLHLLAFRHAHLFVFSGGQGYVANDAILRYLGISVTVGAQPPPGSAIPHRVAVHHTAPTHRTYNSVTPPRDPLRVLLRKATACECLVVTIW